MEVVDFIQSLPNDFMRLGCGSLKHIVNMNFSPRNVDLLELDIEDFADDGEPELDARMMHGSSEPIEVMPVFDDTPVFGVDTSSIELGETGEGILCAVRGSIVWREAGFYQYIRHGPFIFHITEKNRHVLYNNLRQVYFGVHDEVYTPGLEVMQGHIRNILERWLQKQISQFCYGSLLLWDGSLTARTIDSPASVLSTLLHLARNRQNLVLALSKNTRLYVSGQKVTDLIDNRDAPCLIDIDDVVRLRYGSYLRFLGRVYAIKMAPGSFTFRLDIDRRLPEAEGIQAVQRLIGNDLIVESYPETLRIAHIISRFSASEVIGMQRYIAENYGLRVLHRPDVGQALFGPYASSHTGNERNRSQ